MEWSLIVAVLSIDCLPQIGYTQQHFGCETRIEFNRQLNKCFFYEKTDQSLGNFNMHGEGAEVFGIELKITFAKVVVILMERLNTEWIERFWERKKTPLDKSERAQNAKFSWIVDAIDKTIALKFVTDRITICSTSWVLWRLEVFRNGKRTVRMLSTWCINSVMNALCTESFMFLTFVSEYLMPFKMKRIYDDHTFS